MANDSGVLYSDLKLFAFPEKINDVLNGRISAPLHVRIKPINACNHSCWFCAYRSDMVELGSDMRLKDRIPRSKMSEIVEDLIEMGVHAVTFSGGGEPLIYPHIVETVNSLSAGGLKIGCLSNGAFLKDAVADAFAAHASWIRISMDYWDAESCAKTRKVKEKEFSVIMDNLRRFRARAGDCVLGVSFIVTHENADYLLEISKTLQDLGVDHIKFSPCIVSNSGSENNAYHQKIEPIVRQQLEAISSLPNRSFNVVDHYHLLEEKFTKEYSSCPFLQMLTVIGADCKVYTCQDKAYTDSGCLGSIADQRFKDFWFSDSTRKKIMEFNPATTCGHHCVANSKNKLINSLQSLNPAHRHFV